MTAETISGEQKKPQTQVRYRGGTSEAVYGFGLIGAWVYYLSHATTFWIGVLGIFKGIFWPAVLVYEVLKHLGM